MSLRSEANYAWEYWEREEDDVVEGSLIPRDHPQKSLIVQEGAVLIATFVGTFEEAREWRETLPGGLNYDG